TRCRRTRRRWPRRRRRSSPRSSSSTTTSPSTARRSSGSACSRSGTGRSRLFRNRPPMTRSGAGWLVLCWLGLAALARDGLPSRPALWEAIGQGRLWLLPLALSLVLPLLVWRRPRGDHGAGAVLLAAGALGLGWLAVESFAGPAQPALGWGGGALALAYLM